MVAIRLKRQKTLIITSLVLNCFGLYFPFLSQHFWFDILGKIRDAIKSGDSGHLILAAASTNFLNSIQNMFFFLGTILLICCLDFQVLEKPWKRFLVSFSLIILLNWLVILIYEWRLEYVPTILSSIISLFLFEIIIRETYNFLQVSIVSVQVFFAFQWLNIMPLLKKFSFGRSDIPLSIKIAGEYLNAGTVLNFVGFAFFLPFICSAFITTVLFISYSRNIRTMEENHEKEKKLQNLKVKALENRIYQELHSLVHDLKTPLSTIRGLNSLLEMIDTKKKSREYSERIEDSVVKMNEMISGILYESARQKLKVIELINYIRAQLPLEDENIKIEIYMGENLPMIHVNKIRVARAVINLLENAIVAPCKYPYKKINFEVNSHLNGILIRVKDNGVGMKESDSSHIWEAGYTTKNTSGLGLPFAKQVIESHNGWIDIKSQPGQGTTATLFLPSSI